MSISWTDISSKILHYSPDFVKAISKVVKIPMDCHLMVTDRMIILRAWQSRCGIYLPSCGNVNSDAFRIINKIRANGCKVGVVLNPATPLSYIQHYIHLVDKLTIMSVDPGFAGQPFMPEDAG